MYQIAPGKLHCILSITLLIVATQGSIACKRKSAQRVAEGTAVELISHKLKKDLDRLEQAATPTPTPDYSVTPTPTPAPTPDIVFIDGYKCSRSNYNTANELRDRFDKLLSEAKAKREKLDDMKIHYDHLKTLVDIACSGTTSSEYPGCKLRLDEWVDYERQYNYEIASFKTLSGICDSELQGYISFLKMNCE